MTCCGSNSLLCVLLLPQIPDYLSKSLMADKQRVEIDLGGMWEDGREAVTTEEERK